MAIRLKGTLNTVAGATSESYLRVEFVKLMPWLGKVEYNPILFKNDLEAGMSKVRYYGDPPPTSSLPIPIMSMSLESGSLDTEVSWDDIQEFPVTGALQEVTVNHYSTTVKSASIEVTDFDENGNEVTSSELMYWNEFGIASQSLEMRNPIDLSKTGSIVQQCYEHFKGVLAEQIPAENILNI